jgi:hypothetical protein
MIVAVVRFAFPSPLSPEEARTVYAESAVDYQHVDGLRRKHYLLGDDGFRAGGVYLWESREQAEALYTQEWRDRLTARYGSAPSVEYFNSYVTVDPSGITLD